MCHVKRQNISGWQVYRDDLRPDTRPAATADELRQALAAGELRPGRLRYGVLVVALPDQPARRHPQLDRCFVAELNGTPEGSAVAEAVVRLSQALNLDTVAEGIENVAQATELTLLGYPLAQGYHFARPMDPEHIEALLDDAQPGWPNPRRQ